MIFNKYKKSIKIGLYILTVLTIPTIILGSQIKLDVGKIVNFNSISNADYQFILSQEEILDLYPEYKLADYIDFSSNHNTTRTQVVTSSDSSDYANKLSYLITNNILNRFGNYIYNKTNTVVTTSRVTHNPNNEYDSDSFNPKFYNPDSIVSKTDFITNLMKTEEVLRSRLIAVQNPYTRYTVNGNKISVIEEPITSSEYTEELSNITKNDFQINLQEDEDDMTFDTLDTIINYSIFNQLNILATNDVTEQYLYKALQMGVISEDEIGGIEGQMFLDNLPSNNKIPIYGSWYDTNPIRQYFNQTTMTEDLTGVILNSSENCNDSKDGLTYPWGDSFYYNVGRCAFGNTFNQDDSGVEILKRPSILEYRLENIPDAKEGGQGYQYMEREEITLSETYVLVYKMLLSSNSNSKLTQTEIDYINSTYGLDMIKMTAEEQEAVKYLIARGIINPDSDNLRFSISNSLTNNDMVDLLYRVYNKDARYDINIKLSEMDKDMLDKGYSKMSLLNVNDIPNVVPTYTYDNSNNTTWIDAMLNDRNTSLNLYDYIYIKMPDGFDIDSDKVFMSTNDEYNVIIPPFTRQLIGASNDSNIINPPEDTKDDYYLSESSYVLNDTTNKTVWQRYIIHKNTASNLKINITIDNKTYTYTGFSGEGIYLPNDNVNSNNLNRSVNKITLSSAMNKSKKSDTYYNLVSYVVSNDIAMRNDVYEKQTSIFTYTVYADDTIDSILQNQRNEMQGELRLGAYTETQLKSLTYNGQPIIIYNNGKYEIDMSVPISTFDKQRLSSVTIEQVGTDYYLLYPATSSSIAYDISSFISALGQVANTATDINSKFPVYAQISGNNQQIALISEDDIKNTFNVEIVNDKLLLNKNTGQKAFLNTDENFTLIGNNITKYPKDKMMVVALGGVRFYNLDIIMELLNDSKLVSTSAGSKMYMTENLSYDFTPVNVYDSSDRDVIGNNYTLMDKSYILHNSDNYKKSGAYINLSALTTNASNFIFYKDLESTNPLNMLIVYYPKVGDIKSTDYTNNGLLFSTNQVKLDTNVNPNTTNIYKSNAQTLSSLLFSAGGSDLTSPVEGVNSLTEVSMDVLPTDYQYDVYFLLDSSVSDLQVSEVFTSFEQKLVSIKGGSALINNSIILDKLSNKGLSDNDIVKSNVKFDILYTLQDINDRVNVNANFYLEPTTNNLYFCTQLPNTDASNSEVYRNIFKNRIYTDANAGTFNCFFRSKKYYTNTPEDYIPLEYLVVNNTLGNFQDTSGTGSVNLYNTGNLNDKMNLTVTANNINTTNGSNLLINTSNDVSLYTGVNGNNTFVSLKEVLSNIEYKEDESFMNVFHRANIKWFENTYNEEIGTTDNGSDRIQLSEVSLINSITDVSNEELLKMYSYSWSNASTLIAHFDYKSNTYNQILINKSNKQKYFDANVSVKELLDYVGDIDVPVYIPIPAGTTLVEPTGKLITLPSSSIRKEVTFVSDIINNLLSKLILKTGDYTLLADIPKNSIVYLNDKPLLKTSDTSERNQWQKMMVMPSEKMPLLYYLDNVTDYNIAYNLYLQLFNTTIPNIFGPDVAKINMLQASGSGIWSLPTTNLLINNDNKLNSSISKVLPSDVKNIWTIESKGKDNNTGTDLPMLLQSKNDNVKYITGDKIKDNQGYLLPIINLVPSLQVKERNGEANAYDIIGYIVPSVFNIDLDDEYISYLGTRNTDAFSPSKILDALKSLSFNGEYYRNLALAKLGNTFLFKLLRFIEELVAILLILQWSFVTLFFAIQFTPFGSFITQSMLDFLHLDMVSKVSFGLFNCFDDSSLKENLIKYFFYFMGVIFACLVLWNGYLVDLILMLVFIFIGG